MGGGGLGRKRGGRGGGRRGGKSEERKREGGEEEKNSGESNDTIIFTMLPTFTVLPRLVLLVGVPTGTRATPLQLTTYSN